MTEPPFLSQVDQQVARLAATNENHIEHAAGMLERIGDESATTLAVATGIVDACDAVGNPRVEVVAQLLASMYVKEAVRRAAERT